MRQLLLLFLLFPVAAPCIAQTGNEPAASKINVEDIEKQVAAKMARGLNVDAMLLLNQRAERARKNGDHVELALLYVRMAKLASDPHGKQRTDVVAAANMIDAAMALALRRGDQAVLDSIYGDAIAFANQHARELIPWMKELRRDAIVLVRMKDVARDAYWRVKLAKREYDQAHSRAEEVERSVRSAREGNVLPNANAPLQDEYLRAQIAKNATFSKWIEARKTFEAISGKPWRKTFPTPQDNPFGIR